MRVSVIIPAWNLWEMTAACLRSLAECSIGEDLEVLVVDNGSTDATARELEPLGQRLWGADFRALRLPENLGDAIDALEEDELIRGILGSYAFPRYVQAKKIEWKEYCAQITQWEVQQYLNEL